MTALSIHLMGLRVAAAAIGSEVLVSVLSKANRSVAEAAVANGGRILCVEERDPLVVWAGSGGAAGDASAACRTACDLMRNIRRLQHLLVRKHGVRLCPRAGIATEGARSGERRNRLMGESPAERQVIARARLLQRANLFYGTSILLDGVTADSAVSQMELREIDRLTPGREGLLRGPEAARVTGISDEELSAFEGPSAVIHELLGPTGEVTPERLGSTVAFRGALELFRQREWRKASAILELLSAFPNPDPLVRIYLSRCRQCDAGAEGPQDASELRDAHGA